MTEAEPETRAMSIRGIPEHTYERLRVRAAKRGRSMEAEVREILDDAASEPIEADLEPENLGELIRKRFAGTGGLGDLMIPSRKDPNEWVPISE